MHILPGSIVRSTAGRDRGRLYVVVALTPNRALVADGYRRTISAPKPKNFFHLQPVGSADRIGTDEELRRALQSAESKSSKREGITVGETGCG